jgi:serine/threonine protein kinase
MDPSCPNRVRFGAFELDLRAGELQKGTRKILLQEQPFQILYMLVEQTGNLVTREEIRRKLWPNDTVVEFDHSIHAAINKLRQALGDSADKPKYIETVARRGYRLMVEVEWEKAESKEESRGKTSNAVPPAAVADGNLVGKRVSHYRVLEVIGGGGMGLVYKAEDIKLGRRVALKFLPQELADDPLSLARFEREARAASALDHPNICAVHEFAEHEGQPFIVMQLLEGETLRELIERTKTAASVLADEDRGTTLPLETLLDLSLQITSGLEAAHKKGIIHRDIKPANLFVTENCKIKILDFGLVKGCDAPPPTNYLADTKITAPEANLGLTRTGLAVGTASYMSPEQLLGEKLDPRSDLFSFGVVLYEMATGHQAFSGHTAAAIRDAILNAAPIDAHELSPKIPAKLEDIIRKALEKDREKRYQNAGEIREDLQDLRDAMRPHVILGRRALTIVGVLVLLFATAFVYRTTQRARTIPEVKFRQLTTNLEENPISTGAISPDRKYLAYTDPLGIHIKALSTGETNDIPQPEELKGRLVNWEVACWLPEGTRFLANLIPRPERYSDIVRSSIWMVSVVGGTPRLLRENAEVESLSPDGSLVAFTSDWVKQGPRELWLMAVDGSNARKVEQANDTYGIVKVRWSPDGSRLAYFRTGTDTLQTRDIKGGPAKQVMSFAEVGFHDFLWLPDGRILYAIEDPDPNGSTCNYWQARISPGTGELIEKPRRVTNWVGVCMDSMSLTVDGKHLAFLEWAGRTSVFVADLDDNGAHVTDSRPFTLSERWNYPFGWTEDSQSVLFVSPRDDYWGIFRQPLDHGLGTLIVRVPEMIAAARPSPDGKWILFMIPPENEKASSQAKLMRVPLGGGQPEFVFGAKWSPNLAMTRAYHWPFACAKAPAMLCVLAEQSEDRNRLIFTAFNPLQGRGKELAEFAVDPGGQYVWDLSPDAGTIAILKNSETRISLLPLDGGSPREIHVRSLYALDAVTWTQNRRGFLVSCQFPGASDVLLVDLDGNAHQLWKKEGGLATFGIPSPDGRHLALLGWTLNSNIWEMENF